MMFNLTSYDKNDKQVSQFCEDALENIDRAIDLLSNSIDYDIDEDNEEEVERLETLDNLKDYLEDVQAELYEHILKIEELL